MARATEILLTGRFVEAAEAKEIGLVTDVVPDDQLMSRAEEIAGLIAANSPSSMKLTKRVLHSSANASSLEAALEVENRNQVLATRTFDMQEALSAFKDNRPPFFVGF
jgi:enoyl-CoA hydratase